MYRDLNKFEHVSISPRMFDEDNYAIFYRFSK